jgi:hypothetical protein
MSGTENEAVQAGAKALWDAYIDERPGPWDAASEEHRAPFLADSRAYHDAMREIIAREVIAGVCHPPIDWQAVIASWAQLRPFPVRWLAGIPAPEPCPFDECDTGPLGRDQLNAHIAQQHLDARSVQSVLGGDDPRSSHGQQ